MTTTLRQQARSRREPAHDIEPIFYERWSPRAMTGESITRDQLGRLFEAARWAPSSYNRQPWRFLYALRGDEHWDDFMDLLADANREWAEAAAVLVVIASRRTLDDGSIARTHSFDTGAAWQNLALQGARMGLVVHGMEGFDHERARRVLHIPDAFAIEAMCAIGHHGDAADLPENKRDQERPRDRDPIRAFTMHGPFRDRRDTQSA